MNAEVYRQPEVWQNFGSPAYEIHYHYKPGEWKKYVGGLIPIECFSVPGISTIEGAIVAFPVLSGGELYSIGTGFRIKTDGTVQTAFHVWRSLVKNAANGEAWVKLETGQVIHLETPKLIIANEIADVAIFQSDQLAGQDCLSTAIQGLSEDGPYYMIGYPASSEFFPILPTQLLCVVAVGSLLDKKELRRPNRQCLRSACANGFSGSPILDIYNQVRGLTTNATMSFSKDDYIHVAPADLFPKI